MKVFVFALILVSCATSDAQQKADNRSESAAVSVPVIVDQNRIIVSAEIVLAQGETESVRAQIVTSARDIGLSQRLAGHVARSMGRPYECRGQTCLGPGPVAVIIGGLRIPTTHVAGFTLLTPDPDNPVLELGLPAEVSIPLCALRDYDVLIDFPGRKFTIGAPGSIQFQGSSAKVRIDPDDGSIQISSQIEKKKYDLDLDLDGDLSFLSSDLFGSLATAHSDWPQMVGMVGPASSLNLVNKRYTRVMRLDRLQFGPLFLTSVAVAPNDRIQLLGKPRSSGAVGGEALLNYRVGIDYTHSTVYFDIGRTSNLPDFDVVGLILKGRDDGSYLIVGVADFAGKPSVPAGENGVQADDQLVAVNDTPVHGTTLGTVWSLLGGTPGQEKRLTIARGGKQFIVVATVQHFLAESTDDVSQKNKRKR